MACALGTRPIAACSICKIAIYSNELYVGLYHITTTVYCITEVIGSGAVAWYVAAPVAEGNLTVVNE